MRCGQFLPAPLWRAGRGDAPAGDGTLGRTQEDVRALVAAAVAAATRVGALGQLLALFHLEGVATAARGDGVRVVDLEARLGDRVQEVDRGAAQVRRAVGI